MVALRIEDVGRRGRRDVRPRVARRAPLRVVVSSATLRAPRASDVLPLVRRDMLPDGVPYRDTGCEINPSCLRCPLARCQFDEPESERRKLIIDARDREIAFIRRRHGATIKELASTYGLARRTVFRIIAERRAREGREKRDAGNGTRDRSEK